MKRGLGHQGAHPVPDGPAPRTSPSVTVFPKVQVDTPSPNIATLVKGVEISPAVHAVLSQPIKFGQPSNRENKAIPFIVKHLDTRAALPAAPISWQAKTDGTVATTVPPFPLRPVEPVVTPQAPVMMGHHSVDTPVVAVTPKAVTQTKEIARPMLLPVGDGVISDETPSAELRPLHVSTHGEIATESARPKSDVPHPIRQIIQSLPEIPPKHTVQYDIDLHPKELGHVKITLRPTDSTITVHIACDVDTTAQLVRRHVENLSRDLQTMGYTQVNIYLGQSTKHFSDQKMFDGQTDRSIETAAVPEALPTPNTRSPRPLSHGVDIRI